VTNRRRPTGRPGKTANKILGFRIENGVKTNSNTERPATFVETTNNEKNIQNLVFILMH
jgi:hypothetical protein